MLPSTGSDDNRKEALKGLPAPLVLKIKRLSSFPRPCPGAGVGTATEEVQPFLLNTIRLVDVQRGSGWKAVFPTAKQHPSDFEWTHILVQLQHLSTALGLFATHRLWKTIC